MIEKLEIVVDRVQRNLKAGAVQAAVHAAPAPRRASAPRGLEERCLCAFPGVSVWLP